MVYALYRSANDWFGAKIIRICGFFIYDILFIISKLKIIFMTKKILFTRKTIFIAIGLFCVFQILDLYLFLNAGKIKLGFPLGYLQGQPSYLLLVPSFKFSAIAFIVDIIWFYLMGILANRYRHGLVATILVNLLIWTVIAQPWNLKLVSDSPEQIKQSCESQYGYIWVAGGVDTKGHQLIGTCQPLTSSSEQNNLPSSPSTEIPIVETPISPSQPNLIKQGVYGKVTLASGDCMPSAGPELEKKCFMGGISTKVYVREPASTKNMDSVYLKIPTKLITVADSNNDGFYETELPAGTYSIFVEDNGKEYCNFDDGRGGKCLVTVKNGTIKYDLQIDHAVW